MTTRLLPALTAIRRATIRDKLYEKRENPFIITAKHAVGRGNEPIVKQAEGRKKTNADDKIQAPPVEHWWRFRPPTKGLLSLGSSP